jgi:signal transduction histidine kinase
MKTIAALLLCLAIPTLSGAEERALPRDAESLVHRAVGFLRAEGKDKALAVFSDPKGQFTYRDLYIVVYDLQGKCLAHGAKKERIGKSFLAEKDADGKLFVQERVQLAKEKGKGWQEYKFENPTSKKVETKVAYMERVDDFVVLAGAYKP